MYKKVNVVMLPSKNGRSKIGLNPNALFNKPHLYYFNEGAVYHECQNLYITSDEEIKEGNDYVYDKLANKIHMADEGIVSISKHNNRFKKIIATTDKSITINGYDSSDEDAVVNCYLPQIPQQFIEKYIEEYNKGNVISEVMVEYNKKGIIQRGRGGERTITIRKIKESWSREEVIELLHKSLNANVVFNDKFNKIFHEQLDEWIKENL